MDFFVDLPDEHEHDHDHEERTVEVFSIETEDGEVFFEKLEEIKNKGKIFWICQEVFLDEDREEIVERGDYVVFEFRDGLVSFVEDEEAQKLVENFNNRRSP